MTPPTRLQNNAPNTRFQGKKEERKKEKEKKAEKNGKGREGKGKRAKGKKKMEEKRKMEGSGRWTEAEGGRKIAYDGEG